MLQPLPKVLKAVGEKGSARRKFKSRWDNDEKEKKGVEAAKNVSDNNRLGALTPDLVNSCTGTSSVQEYVLFSLLIFINRFFCSRSKREWLKAPSSARGQIFDFPAQAERLSGTSKPAPTPHQVQGLHFSPFDAPSLMTYIFPSETRARCSYRVEYTFCMLGCCTLSVRCREN